MLGLVRLDTRQTLVAALMTSTIPDKPKETVNINIDNSYLFSNSEFHLAKTHTQFKLRKHLGTKVYKALTRLSND